MKRWIMRIFVRLLILGLLIASFSTYNEGHDKLVQSVSGRVDAVVSDVVEHVGIGSDDSDKYYCYVDYEYNGKQFNHALYDIARSSNTYKTGDVVKLRVDVDGAILENDFMINSFFRFAVITGFAVTVYSFLFLFVHRGKPLPKKQTVLDFVSLYDDLRWNASKWSRFDMSFVFYFLSCIFFVISAFQIFNGKFPYFLLAAVCFFVFAYRKRRELLKKIEEKHFRLEKRTCVGKKVKEDVDGDSYTLIFFGPEKVSVSRKVYEKTAIGAEYCFVFLEEDVKPFASYSLQKFTLDDDLLPYFAGAV